jgi:multicomponent Na+:H+ antiporter subunit G
LPSILSGGRAMSELIGDGLMLIGALFLLLAAVGMLRMPDLFTSIGVTMRALAALAFFLLTAPVTAHLIGRASYFVGTPLWERTVGDELRGRYNPFTHTCDADPSAGREAQGGD